MVIWREDLEEPHSLFLGGFGKQLFHTGALGRGIVEVVFDAAAIFCFRIDGVLPIFARAKGIGQGARNYRHFFKGFGSAEFYAFRELVSNPKSQGSF